MTTRHAIARTVGEKPKADRPSTRERLLAAGLREFGERGFEGARVDRITREANANKQLVYHYFGNKEGLFQSVLEKAYEEYSSRALRATQAEVDAKTALRRFVDHMFRPSLATLYFNQILQDENRFDAGHVKLLPSVKQIYVRVIATVQDILERGVHEGVFRSGIDPREFYISMVGMFNLRTVNAKTLGVALGLPLGTPGGMVRSRQAALDLILRGISNPMPMAALEASKTAARRRGSTDKMPNQKPRRRTNGAGTRCAEAKSSALRTSR
jgi:TetR/AcrR family transcriptional regulator